MLQIMLRSTMDKAKLAQAFGKQCLSRMLGICAFHIKMGLNDIFYFFNLFLLLGFEV
jgi:hypothetical protein